MAMLRKTPKHGERKKAPAERAQLRPNRSIRVRLVVFCLLFTVAYSGACVLVSTRVSSDTIRKVNESTGRIVLTQSGQLIDERLYSLLSQFIAFCNESSLRGIMLDLATQDNKELSPQSYIEIDQSLSNLYSYNHHLIDSVVVYLNDGRAYFCKGSEGLYSIGYSFKEWYARYGNSHCHWLNYHPLDGVVDRRGPRNVYTLFQLVGTPSSQTNGIILLNIDKAYLDSVLKSHTGSGSGYLAIFSEDGASYIEHTGNTGDELIRQSVMAQEEDSGSLCCKIGSDTMYVIYDTLTTNRWRIASITSERDLLAGVAQARSLLLLFSMILMLMSALCAIVFARQLVAPLQLLATKVRAIGSQRVTFDVNTHDEIGVLNDGLSHMMQRIDELNQQVRTELDQKRIAEIASLQAQINPHFLYNTLYDVQQLCELNDTQTAAEMVAMLARFYRIGVSRGNEIIPLREQLTHVISYLSIQKLRYQDVFDYQVDIPEELMDLPTVKLTLQPLVENAIYHGVRLRAEAGGQICIRACREDNDLYVEVADNGPGVPTDKLLELREEMALGMGISGIHSYGLRNVHTRLRLRYGEPYGLLLKSEDGASFTVCVHIPIE